MDATMSKLACLACRRQKRKCTREMPSCQLCQTNQRRCNYPPDSTVLPLCYTQQETKPSLQSLPLDHVPNSSPPPPLFFLDSELFAELRPAPDPPCDPVLPPDLQEIAGYDDEYLLLLAERYFHSTHRILPFVSKRRFKQQICAKNKKADALLLLLSMGAVNQPSNPTAYARAKNCLQLLETQGLISMRLLQSTTLLAYHEISNAIYPAAYLTVGHCARLGQAMGIHDRRNAPQLFKSPTSWVEIEEIRRTWWAVLILDRFVNIGLDNRPFASSHVKPEELLPVEDEYWDRGEQTVTPSLAVSADISLRASTFARTCQASDLLSRVLSHINSNAAAEDRGAYYREALQLHGIVSALHSYLLQEALVQDLPDLSCRVSALGICSSAIIALYYTHSCAEFDDVSGQGTAEQLSMQKASLDGLHQLAPGLSSFAAKLTMVLQSSAKDAVVDPFVTQSFYVMTKLCLWSASESGKLEYMDHVKIFKSALEVIGERFKVASDYLAILDGAMAKLWQ